MNEIFNPSLLISLGSSAQKALEYSKKQLSYLPQDFSNLIEFYNVHELDRLDEEIQNIIDNKLLSAKNLNKLVDLGYKVRSENISSIKINIYLFWDVYDETVSSYETVKTLLGLNYGNTHRDQHSGATLFILSILEKEWLMSQNENIGTTEKMKSIVEYISQEDNMLTMDSKLFILHSVSNDGTRVPREELIYISAFLAYLNILPSKSPPMSQFNRRLLMHEGAYKVGTVGITSITVFKDRLQDEFSKYLALDILNYACEYETNADYHSYNIFNLLKLENQKKDLRWNMELGDKGDYTIGKNERYAINLTEELETYPKLFNDWETYLEKESADIRLNLDENLVLNNGGIKETLEKDLNEIISNNSLREGVKYLNILELEIETQKSRIQAKEPSRIEISQIKQATQANRNEALQKQLQNCPELLGYSVKIMVLIIFIYYSMINLLFPLVNSTLRILFSIVFFLVSFLTGYLYYHRKHSDLYGMIYTYKNEIIEKSDEKLNSYVNKKILEGYDEIIKFIVKKREMLNNYINNLKSSSEIIIPASKKENAAGNLVTDLLDSDDRLRFYKEKAPDIHFTYLKLIKELQIQGKFEGIIPVEKLVDFTNKISKASIDMDFYEYMKFKYISNIDNELMKWIDKGTVKSQYLLQYSNSGTLEEHSFLITSPEVFRASKELLVSRLNNFQVSIVEDKAVYTNCISLIRLCLGIDLNGIAFTGRGKRWEKDV